MAVFPSASFDNFGRANASDWGTASDGRAWAGTNTQLYSITGNLGRMNIVSDPNIMPSYENAFFDLDAAGIGKQDTQEVLCLVMMGSGILGETNPETDAGPMIRRTTNNNFYFVRLLNKTNQVAIAGYVNGVFVEYNRYDRTLVNGTYYWVRFQQGASILRVRVWTEGTIEPTSWSMVVDPSTGGTPYITGKGDWGVAARRTSQSYYMYYKAFYGYTLDDDSVLTFPATDSFLRTSGVGWGINTQGHGWEGNVSIDPAIRVDAQMGYISTSGEAAFSIPDSTERIAVLGPNRAGDAENFALFKINSSAGTTYFHLGLRGTWDASGSGGATAWKGYVVRVTSGGTGLTLWKKSTVGGTLTSITLTTNNTFTALTANTLYRIRFQIRGTTLQARLWADGSAEPGIWHAAGTDSSITGSGKGFYVFSQNSSTARIITLSTATIGPPTLTGTLYTLPGAVTATVLTDTSLTIRAAFTNDTDADNSLTVEYRLLGATTWTTFGGTKTRTASYYEFTLTGLTKNSSYQVRTTFADPDDVGGTNPQTTTFSTTNGGVYTGALSVTGVTATTASLEATYTDDNNANSSAIVEYRVSGRNINSISDSFFGGNGTALEDHLPEVGAAWVRHPLSAAKPLSLWQGRLYAATTLPTETVLYYNSTVPGDAEYDVAAQYYVPVVNFDVGICGRMSTTLGTYYYVKYNVSTTTWQLLRAVNGGADILLGEYQQYLTAGLAYDVILRLRNGYKAVYVDGTEIIRSTDNTIATTGVAGIKVTSAAAPAVPTGGAGYTYAVEGLPTNQINLDDYTVNYRISGTSFTNAGAMTADRPTKKFTKTVTGLTSDTVYEFRITYSDAEGVQGINPLYITAMSSGAAVELTNITVSSRYTSAVVDVDYTYDTNNDSSVSIQYRRTMDSIWTTVPSSRISVNRTTKKFTTILVALKPSTTYQVRAIIADPNGISEGTSDTRTELFTTTGVVSPDSKQTKHYLWKVFDKQGNYLTTWHDAGVPEYSWHENGGVSDLRVTLNRKISTLQTPESGIDFQHRVDVWCLDPSSDGFGPNLMYDPEFDLGSWALAANASISSTGGPDDSKALNIDALSSGTQLITRSPFIGLFNENTGFDAGAAHVAADGGISHPVPIVIKAIAKARGARLTMFAQAYDSDEEVIDTSDERTDTVGTGWQTLRIEYVPPADAKYIRVCFQNDGVGFMYVDKVEVRPKEMLVYRGRIETFTPKIDQSKEEIEVEILGLVSLLSDDYIEFLQFVAIQPNSDAVLGRRNHGKLDPSEMLKIIIDTARAQNPLCALRYDDDSIQATNTIQGYTFRDQQLRACFDKVRSLCPSGWHYYVEPDGLVVLRGPDSVNEHKLRIGVEIMNFSVERSIRNLKNFVHIKGRQDDDNSELDGHGSIHYTTFDQASIDKYGKRMVFIRDAQITDPDTAELVGEGRLEELNREEQRAQAIVPDDKSINYVSGALRGYNIESFRPGDNVCVFDPVGGPRNTYWDSMIWDSSTWDTSNIYAPLPEAVPIKTIQFSGSEARIELSERQPSASGDFGRLMRWLQLNESDKGEER